MTAAEKYLQAAQNLLAAAAQSQADALEQAAQRIAQALTQGGKLYTFGTGHGHLLALEIFYRAGGMAPVCPILDDRLMLHISASQSTAWERDDSLAEALFTKYPVTKNDVLLCISNSGRNAVPVELALLFQARGAYVIALTSLRHTKAVTPRNATGKRLFEVADLVLDNCGVLGDAILETAKDSMVGPTSTVVGAALLQAIICRVQELAPDVDFFCSSNVDGGDAINEKLIQKYGSEIPCL